MDKILVTGGAGYIGSHVCKALRKAGFLPVTYDNLSMGHKSAVKWGPFFEGDLQSISNLEKAFALHHPIAVMHFAASALVAESILHPEKYYRNNVLGSLNLLEVSLKYGVKKVVFSSSCATFGLAAIIPIDESSPQCPINPYGESKLMVEKILRDFDKAHQMKSVILRYFNAAGADLEGELGENHTPETHLIPLVLQAALGYEPSLSVFGTDFTTPDGSAIRDYIHVNDLAEAHLLALQRLLKEEVSLAFNLGSGSGYSVLEVIEAVEKFTSQKLQVELKGRREGDPSILIADNQKAKKELFWTPKYSDLNTIISTGIRYYEKNSLVGL